MIAPSVADLRLSIGSLGGSSPSGPLDLGIPITERLLRGLPGPRWVLIALWAAVVLATPFVLTGMVRLSGSRAEFDGIGELASQAVLSYVVALLLFGVARLVDHATALAPDVAQMTVDRQQPNELTRRRDVAGPLSLTVVVVLVASGSSWSINGVLRLDLRVALDRARSTRAHSSRVAPVPAGSESRPWCRRVARVQRLCPPRGSRLADSRGDDW